MKISEFKERVDQIGNDDTWEVNEICLRWLKDISNEYGDREGMIMRELLIVIENMIMEH